MSEANGHREHLEQRAGEVRARLERRLELIDERRHRLTDAARSVTRPPLPLLFFAAAGAAATFFLVQRLRARRAPMRLADWLAPAAPPREKSALVQGLQKAATSLAIVAVQRLGRQGLDRLLAGPEQRQDEPSSVRAS